MRFIESFIADHGWPPTRGEIAAGLGLKNRQGIDQHLKALATKKAIQLTPKISRGIRLLRPTNPDSATASDPAWTVDNPLDADGCHRNTTEPPDPADSMSYRPASLRSKI